MNQANVTHSAAKIYYKLKPRRKLATPQGPPNRLRTISKTVTALIKYERLELNYARGDEARGYVERLISEAIRRGPQDKEMMDLANFYILEKQLIHKLFKVLVPRFQDYSFNYTKLHKAPNDYVNVSYNRAILELRGNIYPSLTHAVAPENMLLHNILLTEARKEFRTKKYKEIAESMNKES